MYSDEPILRGIKFGIEENQTKCMNPLCYRTKLRCYTRMTREQKQYLMNHQKEISQELYLKWFHNQLEGAI